MVDLCMTPTDFCTILKETSPDLNETFKHSGLLCLLFPPIDYTVNDKWTELYAKVSKRDEEGPQPNVNML